MVKNLPAMWETWVQSLDWEDPQRGSVQPPGLYSSWNSLGQNPGVGSCSLLQRIFPTQGLKPGLPHFRQILYCLRHQESPRIFEWVAYPFSRRSSQPRNWTGVSCIAGRFFTNWVTREDFQSHIIKEGAGWKGLLWLFFKAITAIPVFHASFDCPHCILKLRGDPISWFGLWTLWISQ